MTLDQIEKALGAAVPTDLRPEGLYAPIRYALEMGGKRLRPMLLSMVHALYREEEPPYLAAACNAVEIFHNFTLLHDDLMDDAPMRRGQPTVYRKWDANTAILSGDVMMIVAYRQLEALPPHLLGAVLREFNAMATGVCEGQQYDMEFEHRNDVTLPEYMEMIHYKTSCLIASSMKIGALIAEAPAADLETLYRVGDNMGLAFQLLDDYLDIWGKADFGKRQGGDILEEKKTWLFLQAQQRSLQEPRHPLAQALSLANEEEKIATVTALYERYELNQQLLTLAREYSEKALAELGTLPLPEAKKQPLSDLIQQLTTRTL